MEQKYTAEDVEKIVSYQAKSMAMVMDAIAGNEPEEDEKHKLMRAHKI